MCSLEVSSYRVCTSCLCIVRGCNSEDIHSMMVKSGMASVNIFSVQKILMKSGGKF